MHRVLLISVLVNLGVMNMNSAEGQHPSGWRAHDLKRPLPAVVTPGESNLPLKPPSDAVVLFDGSDLANWRSGNGNEPEWKIVDGVMESGKGYIFSKQEFGDCQLHIEWAAPSKVEGNGQGRGNSGVYLMGKYEVQVLDSFENETYADGGAGALYGQYPPLVNASRKPGEWQSYDIIFRQPRFDDQGKLKSAARLTVLHNGVLIQDNSELIGPTSWIMHDEYVAGPTKGSLSLQDHGNPVRFRNIWIRELPAERPRPESPYRSEIAKVELTAELKSRLVGEYEGFSVTEADGKLFLNHLGKKLEMLPVSESEFEFRYSAGQIKFQSAGDGKIESAEIHVDAAGKMAGKRKN